MKLIGWIFFLTGLAVLIPGLIWLERTRQYSDRSDVVVGQISKQVQDICTSSRRNGPSRDYICYGPYVKYDFQGETYEVALAERQSWRYETNQPVELLVDRRDPRNVAFNDFMVWLMPLLIVVLGATFGLVGFFVLKTVIGRKQLFAWLKENGSTIQGNVFRSGPDVRLQLNGRHPWLVEASWVHPMTREVHIAKTLEELWYDPAGTGQIPADGLVQIKYDPQNPKRAMIVLGAAKPRPAAS